MLPPKPVLTVEERELFRDVCLNDEFADVFLKQLEIFSLDLQQSVLTLHALDTEDDVRRLMRTKSEATGALKLFMLFKRHIETLRKPPKVDPKVVPLKKRTTHHA